MSKHAWDLPCAHPIDLPRGHRVAGRAEGTHGPCPSRSPQPEGAIRTPSPAESLPRCPVKGCVFPVASHGAEECLLHELIKREPAHFRSRQPSILLLDQAKFGVPNPEQADLRARDRRRLAMLREKSLEEVA